MWKRVEFLVNISPGFHEVFDFFTGPLAIIQVLDDGVISSRTGDIGVLHQQYTKIHQCFKCLPTSIFNTMPHTVSPIHHHILQKQGGLDCWLSLHNSVCNLWVWGADIASYPKPQSTWNTYQNKANKNNTKLHLIASPNKVWNVPRLKLPIVKNKEK